MNKLLWGHEEGNGYLCLKCQKRLQAGDTGLALKYEWQFARRKRKSDIVN